MRPSFTLPHLLACGALGLLLAAALPAEESPRRQQAAHAHGEGVLEVAVDGDELLVGFRIPAANVVGFEHAPADEEQRRRVAEAKQRFLDGAELLVPSTAAGCRLLRSEAMLGGGTHEGESTHRREAHGRQHGGDGREGHSTQAGHPVTSDGDTHSELSAEYLFRCERPDELTEIDVRLLDALLGVRTVEAHVVTPGYQGAVELTPRRTTLKLVH